MESKDLRIGNIILVNGEIQEVCELPLPNNCSKDNTQGVFLTDEWMFKFGFNKDKNCFVKDDFFIFSNKTPVGIANKVTDPFYIAVRSITSIKYVHQLQNLYFALSKKELTKDMYQELADHLNQVNIRKGNF